MKQISDQNPMQNPVKTPALEHRPDPRVTRILISLLVMVAGAALLKTTVQVNPASNSLLNQDFQEPLAGLQQASLTFRTESTDLHIEGGNTSGLLEATYSGPKGASIERNGSTRGSTADLRFEEHYPRGFRAPFSFGYYAPKLQVNLSDQIPLQLAASTASGDLNLQLEQLQLSGLKASTVSGDLNLTLPEASEMEVHLKSTSGEVQVGTEAEQERSASSTGTFESSTISGNQKLDLKDTHFRHILVTANSGDLAVQLPASNRLKSEVRSISGDQVVELDGLSKGTLTLLSTSGDITLTLPENINAEISTATVSGDVYPDGFVQRSGGIYQLGNGPAELTIQIKTVSGDVHLSTQGGF
ncbi:DUF4097 family beta strand repeat-containing protein [Deinococcus roseus]|uniref:DUF4097 domain-containing protein n=1 Tax=Deinococcus roseus TaxID=392414 RepID=A0ABQ2CY97_9DEIO|nr:DUF4097 family beta strand repeat-containing protein [Deinococcus roseus]GGJ32681.1 hypothetical protein GCM10008938_18670 [Deinococcus roseus]